MDTSHMVLFAAISLSIYKTLQYSKKFFLSSSILTIVISFTLIILIEIIQPIIDRTRSIEDVLFGMIGVLISVFWCKYSPRITKFTHKIIFAASLVMVSIIAGNNALLEWYAVYWRDQNMPVLGTFENNIETKLWLAYGGSENKKTTAHRIKINNKTNNKIQSYALRITTVPGQWSGVVYHAGDLDWSIFQVLSFDIFNPEDAYNLGMRIDDSGPSNEYGQRYNRKIEVKNGWNTFRIPLEEIENNVSDGDFNSQQIRKLLIFAGADDPERRFYLDNVRLKNIFPD